MVSPVQKRAAVEMVVCMTVEKRGWAFGASFRD
jgi:hypothetical protein